MANGKKLTDLEERCCQAFMANGGNQSEAFRQSKRGIEKWKDSTVWTKASVLFSQPHVQARLDELREQARKIAADKFEISVERLLQEFVAIGLADVRKLFNGNQLVLPENLPDEIAGAISQVEVTTFSQPGPDGEGGQIEYTYKFKMHNKLKALESLAQYLRFFQQGEKTRDTERFTYNEHTLPAWMREMIPGCESEEE